MAEEETQSLFTQCVVPCVSKASIHPSIGSGKHITRYNSGVKCSLSSQTVSPRILVHARTRTTFIFVKTVVEFDAVLRFARIHGHHDYRIAMGVAFYSNRRTTASVSRYLLVFLLFLRNEVCVSQNISRGPFVVRPPPAISYPGIDS